MTKKNANAPTHTTNHPAQHARLGDNGWTGGQYSLFRILFASYLFIHFIHLAPWAIETFSNAGVLPDQSLSPLMRLFPNILLLNDSPATIIFMITLASLASVFLAIGKFDRIAALLLWYILACLFARNPLTANPSLPFVGWILIAHAIFPAAPYGSLAARGRVDPRGNWHYPQPLFVAAWALMAIAYTYSGYTKMVSPSWVDGTAMQRVLENPLARPTILREWLLLTPPLLLKLATWGPLALELLFLPLALLRKIRPWLWFAMLGLHLGLILIIDFADLSLGMVMLHAFTFNPAWIRPHPTRPTTRDDHLFYDGHCGLCQRSVRFVLAEDRTGHAFTFAPLQGQRIHELLDQNQTQSLPDSIVVVTHDKKIFVRSNAIIHILTALGGVWRLLGILLRLIPRPIRDAAYNTIARVRHRIFQTPENVCPILPPDLRQRFTI